MSFIHLLFPPGEFELLDHVWYEAAPPTEILNYEENQVGGRNSEPLSKRRHTGHSHSRDLNAYAEHIAIWRKEHLHSKLQSLVLKNHDPSVRGWKRPTYRELTIPRNRGQRYSIPLSSWLEAQTPESTPHSVEVSPSSLSTVDARSDSPSSPNDSVDMPSTPGSGCDQFRTGPFGHMFDSLRVTDQEREFLEEMTQSNVTRPQKRRAPNAAEIVETLSQTTFFDFINQSSNTRPEAEGQIGDDQSSIEVELVEDGDRRQEE